MRSAVTLLFRPQIKPFLSVSFAERLPWVKAAHCQLGSTCKIETKNLLLPQALVIFGANGYLLGFIDLYNL